MSSVEAVTMELLLEPGEEGRQLREEYQRALAVAAAWEWPLREEPRKPARRLRRRIERRLLGAGLMVALAASTLIGLRFARVAPFITYVRMPAVLHLTEATAVQEIRNAGLDVRVLSYKRTIPRGLYRRVLGASDLPAARVAAGSTVTLYVAIPHAHAKRAPR